MADYTKQKPVYFALVILEMGSLELLAQASLEP
jgi:hypothetical protein